MISKRLSHQVLSAASWHTEGASQVPCSLGILLEMPGCLVSTNLIRTGMGSSFDHAKLSFKQKGTKRRALREGDTLAVRTVCPIPIATLLSYYLT